MRIMAVIPDLAFLASINDKHMFFPHIAIIIRIGYKEIRYDECSILALRTASEGIF